MARSSFRCDFCARASARAAAVRVVQLRGEAAPAESPDASVSATEWQASDDEAAELARGRARLLSYTHRNPVADLVGDGTR